MPKHEYSSFTYKVIPSAAQGYKCVEVSYHFDGRLTKRFINIREEANIDFIKEAKKIIEHDLKTKKLDKYSHRYHHNHKPLLIGLSVCVAIILTTVAAVFTSMYVLTPGGGYKPDPIVPQEVKFNVNGPTDKYKVELTTKTSTIANEYETKINLTPINPAPILAYFLPKSLDSVISGKTTLSPTDYEYTLSEDAFSANLKIPATLVTGKITITLTLTNQRPVKKINILPSEECEGVTIPPQQIDAGIKQQFTINIIPISEGDVVSVGKIEFGGQTFLLNEHYDCEIVDENEYLIIFKDIVLKINEDITITATASAAPVDRTLTLNSEEFGFYNKDDEPLENKITFKSNQGSTVYVKTKNSQPQNLPLKLDITYDDNGRELILGKDYEYHFISNDKAELTIAKGDLGNVTVKASPVSDEGVVAMFIVRVPKNTSNNSITFGFNGKIGNGIIVNWGDDRTSFLSWAFDGYNSIGHSYESSTDVDKDYLIKLTKVQNIAVPSEFGFDVYDDKITTNKDTIFSPNEEIAPYCSSISNITSIKLADNVFTKFTAEGLIHTSIDSLYIPSGMQMDGRYISYCEDLSTFYIGPSSEYEVDGSNEMLFEKEGGEETYALVAALSDAVVLNEFNSLSITRMKPYACVGRQNLTALSLGPDFKTYSYGAVIDCPNLKTINVSEGNQTYFSGDNINMVLKQWEDTMAVKTLLLVIENTLAPGEKFPTVVYDFAPFSFSGSNTPKEFIINEEALKVDPETGFNAYSFYRTTNLEKLVLGNPNIPRGDNCSDPCFYGCKNLDVLSISDKFSQANSGWNCPITGVIQECPDLNIEIRNTQSSSHIYVYNGAIYFLTLSSGVGDYNHATLIGTCKNSQIVNGFEAYYESSLVSFYVDNFVNCVFNGNGLDEIYIPNKYNDLNTTNHPFVGCDGAMFTCNSERGFIDTRVNEDGTPIQSIYYIKDGNDKFVLAGVSLLNNNRTLVIPNNINIIGSYSISDSLVEKIVFEETDDTVDEFSDYAIFGCHNLTELNFSKLSAKEASDVPELSNMHAIEDNNYYLAHITIVAKDSIAVNAFKDNASWKRFTNIIS